MDKLCTAVAVMGLKGVDCSSSLSGIPARYGLICIMGYAGGGEINKDMNRLESHAVK